MTGNDDFLGLYFYIAEYQLPAKGSFDIAGMQDMFFASRISKGLMLSAHNICVMDYTLHYI